MAEQVESVQDRLENYLAAEEGEPEQPEQEEEKDGGVQAEAETNPEPEGKEEVDEVNISSFNELAEHEGIPLDSLYNLTFPVTAPDGTSKDIALGEVKDSYQASELLKTERARFGEERAAFEQEATQKKQAMDAAFFTASKVLEDAEGVVMGNWNDTQMNELRVNDPAEYALALTERDRAKAQLVSKKAELKGEYERLMNTQHQEMQAQQAQSLQAAYQALPKFIPEWADEKVATQEKSQLVKYGLGEGYTEEELNSLIDPRVVRSLRKAMMYDAQQKSAPEVKKKVVSIGKKVIKGGNSQSKTERKHDEYTADRREFRKRGGTQDDAAVLIEKHFLGDM